jgi:CHAT domain-containing protein
MSWNVDDDATRQLMIAFYAEMMKGQDQHQAFRIAQQEVRKKFPSPFYWVLSSCGQMIAKNKKIPV